MKSASLAALMLSAAPAAAAEYHSGVTPFETEWSPPDGTFAGDVRVAPALHWKTSLPGQAMNSATHSEYTRPVVSGDSLYVGSAAGRALYKLSRRDGTLIQTYPASSSVESPPVV